MKIINFFKNIPIVIDRVNRLLKVNRISEIVWNELLKLHRKAGWSFGQFDAEKYVETTFSNGAESFMKFQYEITKQKLVFKSVILSDYDADNTHDIMILSSHFNSLLNFGVVKVDTNSRIVRYEYSGDLLLYMLYPDEIHSDISSHYEITKECLWAFNTMLNTGNDPVFVIAELLKRNEQESKEKK